MKRKEKREERKPARKGEEKKKKAISGLACGWYFLAGNHCRWSGIYAKIHRARPFIGK